MSKEKTTVSKSISSNIKQKYTEEEFEGIENKFQKYIQQLQNRNVKANKEIEKS